MKFEANPEIMYAWQIFTSDQAASVYPGTRALNPPLDGEDWSIERDWQDNNGNWQTSQTGGRAGDWLTTRKGGVFKLMGFVNRRAFPTLFRKIPYSIRESHLRGYERG